MKKKILVVMLAVGMVATSLTGCAFETESKRLHIIWNRKLRTLMFLEDLQ